MIDSKDLMIGDWVMLKGELSPQVVQELLFDCVTIQCWPHRYGDISPVPLTPEILEKNGFKIIHGHGYSDTHPTFGWGYLNDVTDHAYIEVSFYDEPIGGVSTLVKMEVNSSSGGGINTVHSCDIDYVHQLQHAIRLCGIDFDFKV